MAFKLLQSLCLPAITLLHLIATPRETLSDDSLILNSLLTSHKDDLSHDTLHRNSNFSHVSVSTANNLISYDSSFFKIKKRNQFTTKFADTTLNKTGQQKVKKAAKLSVDEFGPRKMGGRMRIKNTTIEATTHVINHATSHPINHTTSHHSTPSNESSHSFSASETLQSLQCCNFKDVPRANNCTVRATDIHMNSRVRYMTLKEKLNLVEYTIFFSNYSSNPLFVDSNVHHRPDIWSRASTSYGQTLLSLAFNYGILSLMTLTFGTTRMPVEVADEPSGCFGALEYDEKLALVRNLLMKDFGTEEEDHVSEGGDEIEQMYITESARICQEVVEDVDGFAKFTDCCCYRHRFTGEKKCEVGSNNIWLSFLYSLLNFIRYIIFFFGPLFFLSTMVGLTRDQFPYTVKLKDPLLKSVFLCKSDTEIPDNIRYQHLLDFSNKSTFPKMKESLSTAMHELEELKKEENEKKVDESAVVADDTLSRKSSFYEGSQMELPSSIFGIPVKVSIKEYELFVNYKRLVTENDISIGFWKSITNTVFFCKLKNVGPFQSCCRQDMFRNIPSFLKKSHGPFPWINCWRIVGLILFALFLPFPFYLRLLILYHFELDEVLSRKKLISSLGLQERFENSLLLYLLPTHPLYIFIGILYIFLAIFCIVFSKQHEDGKLKEIVIASFNDLKYLSWTEVFHLLVSNIIWPFKRFGVMGCLVVLIYWPIVVPLTLLVFVIYCLPTMFLTVRIFCNSHKTFHEKRIKRSKKSYRIKKKPDNNLHHFKIENIIGRLFKTSSCITSVDDLESSEYDDIDGNSFKDKDAFSKVKLMKQTSRVSDNLDLDEIDNLNQSKLSKFRSRSLSSTIVKFNDQNKPFQYLKQVWASVVCILIFYSLLIIVTECLGSLVDILVFTLMGIIVNAGKLLKYIALTIMIVVYSYDSFNNVEKKYLKLNKALFTEVKSRIKDLDKVTSLPSYLQENRAFKSQELNEQAEYELCDDVSVKPPRHWFLNDLVLFVDNEDMPRIPKKLFKNVCEIKVAGVPGPVYRGLMLAMKQFLKIVVFIVFVFMVVLTFGSVYQMSNTNQMLAALAGGSLPFILRTFMEPDKPDIEMGTVSFKSKLDEVIKNFAQIWPMYDFSFELYKEPQEEGEDDEKDEEDSKRRGSIKSAILPSNKSFDDDLNNNKIIIRKSSVDSFDAKHKMDEFEIEINEKVKNEKKEEIENEKNDELQDETDSLKQKNATKDQKFSRVKNIDLSTQEKRKSCLKENPKGTSKEKGKKRLSALKMPPVVTSPPARMTHCQTSLECPRSFPMFYSNENIFSEYMPDAQVQEERQEEESPGPSNHRQVGPTKSVLSARVCFSEPAKSVYEQVDLLIIIPENYEETIRLNSEPIFTTSV